MKYVERQRAKLRCSRMKRLRLKHLKFTGQPIKKEETRLHFIFGTETFDGFDQIYCCLSCNNGQFYIQSKSICMYCHLKKRNEIQFFC